MLLSDGARVSLGGWSSDIEHGAEYEGQIGMAGWWAVDLGPNNDRPTHWMPLPAAPTKRAEDAGKLAVPSAEPVAWECRAGGLRPLTQAQYEAQPPSIQRHYTKMQPAAVPQPLKDEQILECVRSIGLPKPMGLTRDVGPYEVTEPSYYLQLLVRAIEAAHGITGAAREPSNG